MTYFLNPFCTFCVLLQVTPAKNKSELELASMSSHGKADIVEILDG